MAQCEELKDDDQVSCTLEMFSERDLVLTMIQNLKNCHSNGFEKEYEKYSEILTRYQEQPHLLDPQLETLIETLLTIIRAPECPESLLHCSFKYFYTISKVRTYKVLVKFLPHELNDLEFVLDLLEKQDKNNFDNWETKYILLLWLSILVLNPFHMSRLDAYATGDNLEITANHIPVKPKMERIFDICKEYCDNNDTCANVAAFLAAKYLIRTDIKEIYLEPFFNYVIEHHRSESEYTKFGQLAAVAAILKHGKREDLLPYADMLLQWILSCDYKISADFLKNKYFMKIVQRLGLIYLKPRIATWRYKRGSRSLAANLTPTTPEVDTSMKACLAEDENDDDICVPESIEDVIEELLQGLRSASSDIRWSSAKGLGRVTSRLPKSLGDDVVGTIIEILSPLEPHEAWHGACLAIAELAKRGLLLPYRLNALVPLVLEALVYDEMKGYMSVGQHIRDSACYMCWAFARAYDPKDILPFINQIACGLLITALFDREINCRRAASAAFQEIVGRLGNFPGGIDISTKTDFYSVGLRNNSYLNISEFISSKYNYTKPFIDHLIEKKVNHWDPPIRELTAKALRKLSTHAEKYVANDILPKLFQKTDSIDINARHGSVLAIGEIVCALMEKPDGDMNLKKDRIPSHMLKEINELISKFQKRNLYKGISGELMKKCCADFIKNCCIANFEANQACIESWQEMIDLCIIDKNSQVRELGCAALTQLCLTYYQTNSYNKNDDMIDKYLIGAENDLEEHIRMGYVSALGALPKFLLSESSFERIAQCLIKYAQLPYGALEAIMTGQPKSKITNENPITYNWSESRRDSVKALANILESIDYIYARMDKRILNKMFDCYMKCMEEYTLDNRGDIGAWVRESAMSAVYQLAIHCDDYLTKEQRHLIMTGLAQQAVEKIDRTRGLAAKLFCNLVHADIKSSGELYIPRHQELLNIFPKDDKNVLWHFADHTFPLFCAMLEFEEYSQRLILGLSASIGQLTESLVKHASNSLFRFLRSHPDHVSRICLEVIIVFEENSLNERVTYPMLNFLDNLLSSGSIDSVLTDETSNFPEEVFRLVNIEIKGHKKLYKIVSAINVFCQLIQVPRLCTKILSKMGIFLGLTHVHIRKSAASKLYEAIILYGDECGIDEENLMEIQEILLETDWGMPLPEVRPIRNHLCELMGVKAPVSAAAASSSQ